MARSKNVGEKTIMAAINNKHRKSAAHSRKSVGSKIKTKKTKSDPLLLQTIPDDYEADGDVPSFHYQGVAIRDVGRDVYGKTIPHKRSEITARKVSIWVAGGATKNDIAIRLNIRPGLVEQCYGKELEFGTGQISMDVAEYITKRAKKVDQMAMFYAKSRMNWRESGKPITGDEDELPLPTSININFKDARRQQPKE